MRLERTCPGCGGTREIAVDADAYREWKGGMLIQDAFPRLTPAQREEIQTGYHDECWDKTWAYLEDEPEGPSLFDEMMDVIGWDKLDEVKR